jgi:hypothetical protein
MSSSANNNLGLVAWPELDRDLADLAGQLGAGSATDAWVGAELDELTRAGWDVPTEAEALEAVEEL